MPESGTTRSPVLDENNRELIDQALEYAEETAGTDDAAFVHALRARFFQLAPAPRGVRDTRRSTVAEAGDQSTHIYEDPRYQRNARTLARKRRENFRVIGGSSVPEGEFPDCVAVGSADRWGCTGTLIAPNVVLTAGHCAEVATRVFFGGDVADQEPVIQVRRRVRHPDYNRNGRRNDLLVLVLEEEAAFVPRRVAPAELIDAATDVRVVGFGNVDAFGSFGYGIKRQVDVPIASHLCVGSVGGEEDSAAYGCDYGLEMIAGKPMLARDTCTGDSGGPLYVQGDSGEWFLAGATSRATDSAVNVCGDGGVYVRVDRYLDWISEAAGV